MLNFKILDGKSLFFLNMLKKLQLKKKEISFSKKSSNVAQNQEQASNLAPQVNEASQAIQERQGKLVRQPKTGKRVFLK